MLNSLKTTPLLMLLVLLTNHSAAQVEFQDISTSAGLDYQGRTYGSSWGDINGDGLMDLYLSCHQNAAEGTYENDTIRIFLNMGNGVFDDSIYQLDDGGQSDFHGGIFFDQDNDGDKDMLLLTGGTKKNVFLRNEGGLFLFDTAEEMNLALNKSRGRQGTCLDINNDGTTDILINNEVVSNPLGHGSVVMIADLDEGFIIDPDLGFDDPFSIVSCVSDLDGDGRPEMIVANSDSLKIYSIAADGQFTLDARIDVSNVTDISVADFNGDLLPDIFVARGLTQETDIQLFNDSVIYSCNRLFGNRPPSDLTFKTDGPIEVTLNSLNSTPYDLHFGSDSTISNSSGDHVFLMELDEAYLQGFQDPATCSADLNYSFGILPDDTWHIQLASNVVNGNGVIMNIHSGSPITEFASTGTPQPDEGTRDMLYINDGDLQFTASDDPAFTLDEYSVNVTSGDFDNDMDNDLIVVSTGLAKNRKDHLYENLGNGSFIVHENGWGTKGDVAGIGDAVTTTDFNNDGFLDLFITNGSTAFYLDSAGIDLYQNMGNGDNWITLDLDGVESNADGFGARVVVQANGIEQVGIMTGGIHTACQDDARVHFGLGSAETVEMITIQWPSGIVDVLHDQPVNEIRTLLEGDHEQTTSLPDPITDLRDPALMIDHVIIHNSVGQWMLNLPFDQALPSTDLHLGPGLYVLSYVDKEGQIVAKEKYVQR